MIKDVSQGKVGPKDAISALILINLFHSVFEDTTVMMLLGPSLFVILIARGLFCLGLVWIILKLLSFADQTLWDRFLINKSAFKQ